MSKLVSVIIPTYKREVRQISAAVESVLAQTYDSFQIVVVDDSPADYPHRDEVRVYMEGLGSDKILYIQNEKNLGGSGARNRGIERAQGEYITFLDDDDEYYPDKIKNQVEFMENNPECDLSFSDMIMYNDAGKVVDYRAYDEIESFDNDYLLVYHLTHHMTGTPTFMFKADKLREIGGFDFARVGQEFRIMLKSIERGLNIRYFKTCDVKVHKHAGDALSKGKNKIIGEKELFQLKKTYFPKLKRRDRMFIRFRFHAVLAVAYLRNKNYPMVLVQGVEAVVSSPVDSVVQLINFARKIFTERK